MKLKRTGYVGKIARATLVAVFLAGYVTFATVYLIAKGDHKVLFGPVGLGGLLFLACALLPLLLIGVFVWMFVVLMRHSQLLARKDPTAVFAARMQPDTALTLLDGQTLSLAYMSTDAKVRRSVRLFNGCGLAFMMLFVAAWGEFVVLAALPGFSHSALNPLRELISGGPVTTSPAGLDWLAAACPPVTVIVTTLISFLAPRHEGIRRITADDTGVAVDKGNYQERILWDDIALFARVSNDAIALPFGSYILWGRSHRVEFSIESSEVAAMRKTTGVFSRGEPFFIFDGGYETYHESALRLLATIAVRSSEPLVAMREMSLATWLRRRMPVLMTSEEAAKALPVAGQQYQPSTDDATATLRFGEQLALRVRMALSPILGEWLAWFAIVAAMSFLCGGLGIVQGFQRIVAYSDTTTYPAITFYVSLAALFVITIFPIGAVLILARRRRAFPPVFADGFGISGKSRLQGQLATIPWQSITAWVVIPAPPGSRRPTRYIVFGEGQKIAWSEPADAQLAGRGVKGDRRQAYREQATRIHALIAARTGLPLRELRVDAVPMSGQ